MKTKEQAKKVWMEQAAQSFERDWNAQQKCVYCLNGSVHLYHSDKYTDVMAGDW